MTNKILKIALLLSLFLFGIYQLLLIDIPDITFLKTQNPQRSSYMTSENGLNGDNSNESVTYISLSKVSPHVIKAVVAAEDDLYFTHNGFNWKETFQALQTNFDRKRYARGASTITQQLARNLFLSKDKSLVRKLREWILTYKLEGELSKSRILELYLNFAEFGPGIYGVHAASRHHFKTKPKNLTRHQSALLASMLPNPKVYGKKPYPSKTYRRQKKILYRMAHYDLHLPKGLFPGYRPPKSSASKNGKINLILTQKNASDDFKEFDE